MAIQHGKEPDPVVRPRDEIEDGLVDFDPSIKDPREKLKRRAVRSIVDVLRYQDTQERLGAEAKDKIDNGRPEQVEQNTVAVERNIELFAHMQHMTQAVIESTVLYGRHLQATEQPEMHIPEVIAGAFHEVQTAFGESPKAAQTQALMPSYGLVPEDGQNYVGVRSLNV